MRVLDNDSDKALKNVTLYLTFEEANELKHDLERLIENFGNNEHVHINDSENSREITVVLYDENHLDMFDERSKKLIRKDE